MLLITVSLQVYLLISALSLILSSYMKLNLYIFTSKIELDCPTNLNPEHLSPYCTVDSYYQEEDVLHVRIKHLKTNLTTVKNELLAARSDKL